MCTCPTNRRRMAGTPVLDLETLAYLKAMMYGVYEYWWRMVGIFTTCHLHVVEVSTLDKSRNE